MLFSALRSRAEPQGRARTRSGRQNHPRALTKTRAILLRRIRLTETSLIVTWCSVDHGLIKTVAKGALRPKSPLSGQLDLFLSADLAYAESRRSDLHTLREVSVIHHRFGLRESWRRVLAASYFVRLLEQVAERDTPIPDLFALLGRALDYLENHDPDLRAVLHYERELARALGIQSSSGGTAIEALRHLFHVVPAQREKLLEAMGNESSGATSGAPTG